MNTISVHEARALFENKEAVFVDIRDPASFQDAHIPGAIHLDDENVEEFIDAADKTCTHIIYCYHGNNSQGGAAYFEEQGFQAVYSMSGGYTAW